jgi:hypothetical protein
VLVICNKPDIYAKYKARWIKQQRIIGFVNITSKGMYEPKSTEVPKLWNRLNNDSLTPLSLAAHLSRTNMFTWLLEERKITQWSYGDVSCVLHPLDQLDLDFRDQASQFKFRFIYILICLE